MFGLYVAGIVGALLAALVLRRTAVQRRRRRFMMELPKYQLPRIARPRHRPVAARVDLPEARRRRSSLSPPSSCGRWPASRRPGPARSRSTSRSPGKIADGLEVVVAPIGFNHEIALALIPAMAAREVAVAAIGTVYAIDADDEQGVPNASSNGSRVAGRCRPRWPSSPGSCSRRNASRPSPSPGARPTGGNGRFSCWPICSCSPIWRQERPIGLAVARGTVRRADEWRA